MSPDPRCRVVSVPAAHPYVERLAAPSVRVLADVVDPGTGRWWPPRQLDADWLTAQAATYDLVHVHFGFESFAPARLRAATEALRARGMPLVVTVHDLANPHLPAAAQGDHLARLGVLVEAADAVLTLTPGAAAEIAARWGRAATVVPHPHLVPLDRIRARPVRTGRAVVGVDLKDLRANVAAARLVPALAEVGRRLEVTVRVGLHAAAADTAVGRALRDVEAIDLRVHPPRTDAALWAHLEELDACVLPYAWGTHSGWLETCWDLGTPVVAPDCGRYAEQRPCTTYRTALPGLAEDALVASLTAAVASAIDSAPSLDPLRRRAFRADERARVASVHAAVYDALTLRAAA